MNVLEYSNVNGVVRLETALRPDQELDTVTWGMLTHNQIPGVARTSRTQLDDRVALVFEVVGERLTQYMERPRRKAEVVALLDALVKTLVEAERYMIPLSSFVLTLDDVFVDPATGAVTVVCLPLVDGAQVDPLTFFKQVVFNLRYDERDDSRYVSDLIGVLGGADSLDLARLARVLRTIDLAGAAGPSHAAAPYGIAPGAPTASDVPVSAPATAGAGGYGYVPAGAAPPEAPAVPDVAAPRAVGTATPPSQGPGFAIPGSSGLPVPSAAARRRAVPGSERPAEPSDEKPISLMYLLQHYSAENKAAYDRQRKAKSERKAAQQPHAEHPAPPTPAPGQPQPTSAGYTGAVPTAVPGGAAGLGESFGHTVNLGAVSEYKAQAAASAGAPGYASAEELEVHPAYRPQHAHESPAVVRPGPPVGTVLRGVLRRSGSGEVVRIDKPVFVLGRRRSRVDFALAGETVSKKHAIIHTDADGFSIIDNASTNGVEIDGATIPAMQRVRLVPGVTIVIGDEVFTFDVEA